MDTPALVTFESKKTPRAPLWLGAAAMGLLASAVAFLGSGPSQPEQATSPLQGDQGEVVAAEAEQSSSLLAQTNPIEVSVERVAPQTPEQPRATAAVQQAQAPVDSQLAGRVLLPSDLDPDAADSVRIVYGGGVRGAHPNDPQTASIRPDGTFGPIDLSARELHRAGGLHVRLEGGGLVPQTAWYAAQQGQRRYDVTLEAELGHEIWFYVCDLAGEALPDAQLRLELDTEGPVPRPNIEPRDDGYVRFEGVPAGEVHVVTHAEGYASRRDGAFEVPGPAEAAHIELSPGAALEGQVTFAGEGVEDFQITWWPVGSPATFVQHSFQDRVDGEFILSGVANGPILVSASTAELPPSAPALFDASQDSFLELELMETTVLRGRVVDTYGTPLPEATLGVAVGEGNAPAASWGPRYAVLPDGSFEIDMAPQQGLLRLECEGFAQRNLAYDQEDLGDIAMSEPAPLLVFLEGVPNPQSFAVQGISGVDLPYQYFDDFGEASFPENNVEDVHLQVTLPDGSYLFVSRTFQPGTTAELPIALGDCSLDLTLHNLNDAEGPFQANVELPIGTLAFPFEGSREANFRYLEPGSYSVAIWDANGAVVATQQIEILQGENSARVSLDGGQKIARVFYQGQPLPSAEVSLFRAGEVLPFFTGSTGPQGRLALRADQIAQQIDLTATVEHASFGVTSNASVQSTPEGKLEIEPSFEAAIELTLVDGSRPVRMADVRLQNATGKVMFERAATSDAEGHASWPAVGTGSYRVTVLHANYWPAEAEIEPGQHSMQVRELGDLTLHMHDAGGQPLVGQQLRIVSQEFGISVQQWARAGALKASDLEMRTDGQGQLQIQGLPHGAYRVENAQGVVLNEALIVEPGTTTEVTF